MRNEKSGVTILADDFLAEEVPDTTVTVLDGEPKKKRYRLKQKDASDD